MARTTKGNLRGKAAVDERRDLRERLEDNWLARVASELQDLNDAVRRCVALEGESSFYEWWDDDTQIPPTSSRREQIELIEMRIAFLSTPMFEHEESVPNEEASGEKSQQEAKS